MILRAHQIVLAISFMLVSACNFGEEVESLKELRDGEKVWIFAQFNIEQENNTIEDYYYFGQINASLYKKIINRKIKRGFITLKKIRYWGSDDSVKAYTDELYADEMTFRVEDIQKMDLLKKEPKPGFKYSYSDDLSQETVIDKSSTK